MSSIIFGTGYSARKVKLIEVNDEIVKEIEAGQNTYVADVTLTL